MQSFNGRGAGTTTHLYAFQSDFAAYSTINPDYPGDSLPADKAT